MESALMQNPKESRDIVRSLICKSIIPRTKLQLNEFFEYSLSVSTFIVSLSPKAKVEKHSVKG